MRTVLRTRSSRTTAETAPTDQTVSAWPRPRATSRAVGSPKVARTVISMPPGLTRGLRAMTSSGADGCRGASRTATAAASKHSTQATSPTACHSSVGRSMPTASAATATAMSTVAATTAVADRCSSRVVAVHSAPARPTASTA